MIFSKYLKILASGGNHFVEPIKNGFLSICGNSTKEVFVQNTLLPLTQVTISWTGVKYSVIGKLNGSLLVSWSGTNKTNAINEVNNLMARLK